MSVSHDVYAVYGVVIAPPWQREALDESLAAQAHRRASGSLADIRVHLFMVGDEDHALLGTDYAQLGENTYRAVPSLTVGAGWDDAVLEQVRNLGLTVLSGPCWHIVHDLS
ncbi:MULTISPECIES: hypothetical protein [Streptomyces]|uniref:hypothetical protein n=1 Tax=Streptomyces TaxID=1883 RepID=UPI0033CE687D